MKEKRMLPFIKGDGRPFIIRKQRRNALCNCGSGKKAKNCCGTKEKVFVKKNKLELSVEEKLLKEKESSQNL